MLIVPPLGVLPLLLLLELLLQAAAPRATTAAMAAIAVVRLMDFPFVDRAGARAGSTRSRSADPRSVMKATLPPPKPQLSATPAGKRAPGTAHRVHCCHRAARAMGRADARPAEPEWLRGRYQHGAMRVSGGTR